jgi:acyl-CoA reductase-like NAD-dependent aldehyde dehydrogenase
MASATNAPPIEAVMLINGEPVDARERMDVMNPARPEERVGSIPRGTPEHVRQAIAAARAAQPAWAAKTYAERGAILAKVLDRLDEEIEPRAVLYVRENGKILSDCAGELKGVAARQRLTLELAAELDRQVTMDAPGGRTAIGHLPYGVVVSIVPWNAPVSLAFLQIIPALLAGNALVVKPPETCPLTLIRSIEMIGGLLPRGLVNVVTGMPSEIGDTLTTHPDVGKLAFTGSVPAARKIMANGAGSIKGITLELGGNDPAILLPDADLSDKSMERMARSVYRMTGQVCMAIKRIYVHQTIEKEFVEAFSRTVDRIVVGDGLDKQVTMGPMHTGRALERARGLVADAEKRGGKVRRLGQIPDRTVFERGHFMEPIVVTGISDETPLMAEEQFCPAVPVATFSDVEDALARANNTIYGFGGSVWSRDVKRAADLARRIEAGTVFVNTHGTESVNRRAPYGGVKQSGIGRRAGMDGIREYMQIQTLTTFEE